MKIRLLLTSLLIVVTYLTAKSNAHDKDSMIYAIDQDVAEAQVHIRAEGNLWSLIWDYIDEYNYRKATIKQLSTNGGEDIYKYASAVTIEHVKDGKSDGCSTTTIAHGTRKASLKLCISDNTVRIYAGDGSRCLADNALMHFDGTHGSKILFRQDKPTKQVSIYKAIEYRIPAEFSEFDSVEMLDEYLSASTDSIEGYWQYLDRDVDAPNTIIGGYYKLATVNHGAQYDIIYLGGADKYSGLWLPLQVKGHLYGTIFKDNFDLDWINSQRTQMLSKDVYVTFDQKTIMALHFPLMKSEMRFSRMQR